MASPTQPAGGAEGAGGGAVAVLTSPPPPFSDNHPLTTAQLLLSLDELLDCQQRHARAVRRLRAAWIASVCGLTALHALLWLWERIYG